MVWRVGGAAPTVKHPSHALADAEARRLAEKHPGKQFFVLKGAVGYEFVKPERVQMARLPGAGWVQHDPSIFPRPELYGLEVATFVRVTT